MPKRTPRFALNLPCAPKVVKLATGYDHNWRKQRNRRLDAEPLCRHCAARGFITPAVEVDHIKPKALGGDDAWDNTQSLCKPCHRDKTRQDIRRINRRY